MPVSLNFELSLQIQPKLYFLLPSPLTSARFGAFFRNTFQENLTSLVFTGNSQNYCLQFTWHLNFSWLGLLIFFFRHFAKQKLNSLIFKISSLIIPLGKNYVIIKRFCLSWAASLWYSWLPSVSEEVFPVLSFCPEIKIKYI